MEKSINTGVVTNTEFIDAELAGRGKVRDIYHAGENLLIVTTDRISAFDVVMNEGIPGKGKVLAQISLFWFKRMEDIISNHLITAEVSDFPEEFHPYKEQLEGRSMLVQKANPIPIECVVRGYLSGSGWKEYRESGKVCGIELPSGLEESSKLPEPIFTPATKAHEGHDENISFYEAARLIGSELAARLRDISIKIYKRGAEIARKRGIIIADTKMEFGFVKDNLIVIDELLTPDSSRFWPKDEYKPGVPQNSFDKQFLRDYLESIQWNKQPPPPSLPEEIISKSAEKYHDAYKLFHK